jgi:uncharacterized protein (DUF58 family)
VVFKDPIFLGLSISVAIFLIGNFLFALYSSKHILLRRTSTHNHQNVLSIFEESINLKNKSKVRKFWIEVNDLSQIGKQINSRIVTNLKRNSQFEYKQSMLLLKRGKYKLGPTDLISGDPFGIFTSSKRIPTQNELLVYPFVFYLDNLRNRQNKKLDGEFFESISTSSTIQAAGIREYAPGDPLNRVHWPYSLKHQRLIVKEFDDDKHANLWILLDIENGRHFLNEKPTISKRYKYFSRKSASEEFKFSNDSFEYAVSIAASLANFVVKNHFAVGLRTQGPVGINLKPEKGEEYLNRVFDRLSTVLPVSNLSVRTEINDLLADIPEGSPIILITACNRADLKDISEAAILKNLDLSFIYINSRSFSPQTGDRNEEIIPSILAPILEIKWGDNLQEKLMNFL